MRNLFNLRFQTQPMIVGALSTVMLLALICSLSIQTSLAGSGIAADPESVTPLTVGDKAPEFTVHDVDGEPWQFEPDALEKPVLIITFRGGWCPYCNLHLSELRTVVPQIHELGVDVLFLSGDRPEVLYSNLMMETQDDIEGLDYTIYSDADSHAAIAFGIAFATEDTADEWREWAAEKGRDVEDSSIIRTGALPVPAVYAIDTDGTIRFAFIETDYKVRLPSDEVLAVAAELVQE